MLPERSSVRQYKTWILSGRSTKCGWVGPNFSSCHCCYQRHRAARTTMAGNKPWYRASTYSHEDVQLCSHVRLIELRGSERHPNPQRLKHAGFPHWQKAQLRRWRVLRGWCSCTAAGLWLLSSPPCTSLPQQGLTSEQGSKVTVPNESSPVTTL